MMNVAHRGYLRLSATLALAAVIGTLHVASASADESEPVVFGDPDLETCVKATLGVDAATAVTRSDLAALETLDCRNLPYRLINSLQGLEHAVSLRSLDLTDRLGNSTVGATHEERMESTRLMLEPLRGLSSLAVLRISSINSWGRYDLDVLASLPALHTFEAYTIRNGDLTPLANTRVETLTIWSSSGITDIAPLPSNTNIKYLHLGDLWVSDISALGSMVALEQIELPRTHARTLPDMTEVRGLKHVDLNNSSIDTLGGFAGTGLEHLNVAGTRVAALPPGTGSPSLKYLDISSTLIESLTEISEAANLHTLRAVGAGISDLSPLEGKRHLRMAILESNSITDVAVFGTTPELQQLHLRSNKITDVSGLQLLKQLEVLTLDHNGIRDISPLADLPALREWSALQQVIEEDVRACTVLPKSRGIDFDGTALLVAPPTSFWEPHPQPQTATEYLLALHGSGGARGTSPNFPFSLYVGGEVIGWDGGCAYPEGWLPKANFSVRDTVGATSTVSIALSPMTVQPDSSVTWIDADSWDELGYGPSYVPSLADQGRSIRPKVDYSAFGMRSLFILGPAKTIKASLPTDAGLKFTQQPVTGRDARISPLTLPTGASQTCRWLLAGTVVKTSSCSYQVPTSARGKKLELRVAVTAPDYHPRTYTTSATVLGNLGTVVTPGLINKGATSHTVNVGSTLTATSPTYKVASVTTKFQWLRNGKPISGATAKTYKVTKDDAGAKITVRFVASKSGYANSTTTSQSTIAVRKIFTSAPTPTLSGKPTVGNTLTAKPGTWSPTATLKYRWHRDGSTISGATSSTYKTTTSDLGKKITVRVSATKSGYTTAHRTSGPVTVLRKFTATPTPTISGTPRVGSTLTANAGTWKPGTVALSYQWHRNGKVISGATKRTYVPGPKDAYASFTVKVTAKKSGYTTTSRTSSSVVAAGIAYKNCTALKAHYPDGVAKSATVVDMKSGVPGERITSTTFVSSKLYTLNASLDRDKDSWACEP